MAIQPISIFGPLDPAIVSAINDVSMPAFEQVWGLRAELITARPNGAWALWMLRQADVPGDAAYHITVSGVPVMKIFTDTIEGYGMSLCQCIDHEIKEALVDPTAGLQLAWPGGNIVKEVCDPVSEDAIDLGGGLMGANFVYPSWFDGGAGPWDARGLCEGPGHIRPGGYVEQDINGRWQLSAMRIEEGPRKGLHSWRLGHHGRLAYRAKQR
jgi:hypothetical protein